MNRYIYCRREKDFIYCKSNLSCEQCFTSKNNESVGDEDGRKKNVL